MSTGISTTQAESSSVLDKLDELVPAPLAQFDAFPKLPATYKERSESRGFVTLFVALLAFLLVLNDLGEYIWGWPDYEFSVDSDKANTMLINVDVVINMPCQCTWFIQSNSRISYSCRMSVRWSCQSVTTPGYIQSMPQHIS